MRIANNLKKTFLTAMTFGAVLTACNPDEPIPGPEPTPPIPPKPTTQTFNVSTVDELSSAIKTSAKKNNTIDIQVKGNLAVTPTNDNVIGEAQNTDASRDDMTINWNECKIYWGSQYKVSYPEYVRDTQSFPYTSDKDGKWHFAVDADDEKLWNNPNVLMQKIASKIIELLEHQADDFSAEIAKIKAANPGERIKIYCPFDVTVKDDQVFNDITSLHVENLVATFEIVNKDGNPADLDIKKLWITNLNITNIPWLFASGGNTQVFWGGITGSPHIVIPSNPENTLELTSKYGTSAYTFVSLEFILELAKYTMRSEDNENTIIQYRIDARNVALYISPTMQEKLNWVKENFDGDVINNSDKTRLFLEASNIKVLNMYYVNEWANNTDINMQYIPAYTSDNVKGKTAYTGSDIWVNPNKRKAEVMTRVVPSKSVYASTQKQLVNAKLKQMQR